MHRILLFTKPDGAAAELLSVLEHQGSEVFAVDCRSSVLAELERRSVDLILIDLELRALDLAREVRTAYPATRVVLTGRVPLTERQLERLDCGAAGFLRQPFDLRGAGTFFRAHLGSHSLCRRLWHAERPTSYAD